MAQHDFNIANQTFPNTRIDINNAWAAIVSQSSGATAPSTTYAYQFWYDTTTDRLKIRNADNDAWISVFAFNQTTDSVTLEPNASGDIVLGNVTIDADQTIGAGQDNFVLTYDNATGKVSLEAAAGGDFLPLSGGTLTGTLTLGANTINDVEDIFLRDKLYHDDNTNTYLGFGTNQINLVTGGSTGLILYTNYLQAYENVVGSVHTDTNQGTGIHTPDFQNYNSFVWTLTGSITLGNPSTEIAGMSGVFIFTHSGAGRTVSPQSQYETIDGGALTLSGTAGAVDIVPYFVRSSGNIMLGKPLLNFVNAA